MQSFFQILTMRNILPTKRLPQQKLYNTIIYSLINDIVIELCVSFIITYKCAPNREIGAHSGIGNDSLYLVNSYFLSSLRKFLDIEDKSISLSCFAISELIDEDIFSDISITSF